MMTLLEIRTKIKTIYQKFSMIILPLFKFVIAYLVFTQINKEVGYDPRFTSTLVVLLISLVSAIAPWAVMVFFSLALVLAHVYFASKFLAIFVLAVFLILYCLFLRFSPKQGLAAVIIPLLAPYNLHFAVPMYLGLTQSPLSIFASLTGVVIYRMFAIIKQLADKEITMKLDDVLQFFTDVVDKFLADKEMIAVAVIFALVIVVIYLIRRFSFDYSSEIALAAGAVVNIVAFLIADMKIGMSASVGSIILMSLLSGVIVFIMLTFKRILDFTAVERVQFEDDDYYYYVKAVPKINVPEKTHKVKHITKKSEEFEAEADETEGAFDAGQYSVEVSPEDFEDRNMNSAEERYMKGEEGFEDFEVDLDFEDDNNSKF